MHWDLVMRAQGGYALTRPALTMARRQLVPVQQAGDQIIIGNEDQLSNSISNVGRSAVMLATAPAGQP